MERFLLINGRKIVANYISYLEDFCPQYVSVQMAVVAPKKTWRQCHELFMVREHSNKKTGHGGTGKYMLSIGGRRFGHY